MNLIWYQIYGVFIDDDEVPHEVWMSRKEARDYAKIENQILKSKRAKVKPIAVAMSSQAEYLTQSK